MAASLAAGCGNSESGGGHQMMPAQQAATPRRPAMRPMKAERFMV